MAQLSKHQYKPYTQTSLFCHTDKSVFKAKHFLGIIAEKRITGVHHNSCPLFVLYCYKNIGKIGLN